ncbi:MAG: RNA polymerase subunit sigma-70, partial [Gemmatimonadales bacterium]|nr:RNA polymerase subunit sigma-70 [Gemmatimonadales bacterium]
MGDPWTADRLTPLVYDALHELAVRALRHEGEGHTLQPTALVHEAYLVLSNQRVPEWKNRAHFFGIAARI